MHHGKYHQPDTCIPGKIYYIKNNKPGSLNEYKRVQFVDYLPHPAEVLVRDGNKIKITHRIYLFQKNGKE